MNVAHALTFLVPTRGASRARRRGLVRTWLRRARDRRDLARLDPHLIEDVGVSRAWLEAETSKPFWRA